jgi:hypothetical protein
MKILSSKTKELFLSPEAKKLKQVQKKAQVAFLAEPNQNETTENHN